ncbi:hypothetical protein [Sphingomonas ginkgonis]|nr:hypothetical protein [Sphingomonas ginkgonis]
MKKAWITPEVRTIPVDTAISQLLANVLRERDEAGEPRVAARR